MSFSLYVHLPFCLKKCEYCDFESYSGRLGDIDNYIGAVLNEAKIRAREYKGELATVYFGGGTPSVLTPKQLKRLADELFNIFPPQKEAEITIEANPGATSYEFLKIATQIGINRISLGAQAVQDRLLRLLGRVHGFEQVKTAVGMTKDAGIDNISVDTMFAIPTQTIKDLIETIEETTALGIKHISCYSLILEEGTPLSNKVQSGSLILPDEDLAREMQLETIKLLSKLGFNRYEISNYAMQGYESKHNLVYWNGGDYLGLGCSAHSYMNGVRFANPSYDEYLAGKTKCGVAKIGRAEKLEEAIMLQSRLTAGIDLSGIRHEYGDDAASRLISNAKRYPQYTMIDGKRIKLNDEGLMVQNALIVELIDGLSELVEEIT